ncbi:MAG: YggS family pyridoxal phosphate-dependent enzyme [Fimbriiglobus sp.]|nr:YggS family pyridoxal phosphate-dependent enzyme [Fimbriiglobus sp.]
MTDDELRATLGQRVEDVRGRINAACEHTGRSPDAVTLVAVTKSVSVRVAALLPPLGVPDLGESRPQKLWEKAADIPARWHLIGHLQRNKLDKTVPLCSLLHSVDSDRLLTALNDFGVRRGVPVPVLLEVNCSREEAKGGFAPETLPTLADSLMSLVGLRVDGLMTMAAYSDDPEAARPTFAELRALRDDLRTRTGLPLPHLSMGMSGDFEVAVQEGATLVRIGTTLFEGLEEV